MVKSYLSSLLVLRTPYTYQYMTDLKSHAFTRVRHHLCQVSHHWHCPNHPPITMERTRRRWIKIYLDSHPIIHHKQRRQCKHSSLAPELLKPCPFEYDLAYSSLFIPTHNQYKRLGRSRSRPHRGECQFTNASFDETHPPPPWCSTYEKELIGFCYLPSLRRTMLVGLGLSLISSFVYCVQFLYPPLLALWSGAIWFQEEHWWTFWLQDGATVYLWLIG